MKGVAIAGAVVGVAALAFGIAWVAGRGAPASSSNSPPSSGDTASNAVPPPASSDAQAGFQFGSDLLRTGLAIYQRERAAADQQSSTRQAAGGSTPGGTET